MPILLGFLWFQHNSGEKNIIRLHGIDATCCYTFIGVINVGIVCRKFLTNAFVILVSVYYFYKRHVKCRKSFVGQLELRLFCSNCLGKNFADCCTNELEFRICTNCENIQYEVYKRFERVSTFIISVC